MASELDLLGQEEGAPTGPVESWLVLTLFVCDSSPTSVRARRQIHNCLVAAGLAGVSLEVIDVLERPDLAEAQRILATPALVRHRPLPRRKVIGDLSDWDRVAIALGLGDGPQ